MTDPILVEVLRGGRVESFHRGAYVVCDADGKVVMAAGNIERPTFPRSAVKIMQALPLVESGAADAYGFGDAELAMACASHNGEPRHVDIATAMLAKAGLTDADLECGTQWPSRLQATIALAQSGGRAGPIHNNCSGKHSGFLCACVHSGIGIEGYSRARHRYQDLLADVMTDVTGAAHDESNRGTDGCSIPTYAVPLRAMATGFTKLATGQGLEPQRAAAAKRLMAACMAEPFFVAGTNRADTELMELGAGRIFVKGGAEGVHCGAIPELGLGIALKCDDGTGRASDVVIAALLAHLFRNDQDLSAKLEAEARPTLKNWNGQEVGSLRPAEELAIC